MLNCPTCSKAVNIYAKVCLHCGGSLTPSGSTPEAPRAAAPSPEPCAKCQHGQLIVVSPFYLPDVQNNGSVMPMAVASGLEARWQVLTGGSFRAHVCLTCGYTEWYAQELGALAATVGKIPNVSAVEANGATPYR
ncbi:MAG: hypothetical protein HS104_09070 [Polyangiaceae bacterium]|nr:hypothetical protein [Polyangiaceae bacterium]MCL4756460.1 hypothetical protein [Myxococcales bacterium]